MKPMRTVCVMKRAGKKNAFKNDFSAGNRNEFQQPLFHTFNKSKENTDIMNQKHR